MRFLRMTVFSRNAAEQEIVLVLCTVHQLPKHTGKVLMQYDGTQDMFLKSNKA
jgi:hypothetical protein